MLTSTVIHQKTQRKLLFVACAAICASYFMLLGCRAAEPQPPTITADRTACDKCKMLVSDTRFAAAFGDHEGNTQVFDDIGCMTSRLLAIKTPPHVWVRDYKTDTWIDAKTATYVTSPSIRTPMNYGTVAFLDASDAQRFATTMHGKVIQNFNALLAQSRDRASRVTGEGQAKHTRECAGDVIHELV